MQQPTNIKMRSIALQKTTFWGLYEGSLAADEMYMRVAQPQTRCLPTRNMLGLQHCSNQSPGAGAHVHTPVQFGQLPRAPLQVLPLVPVEAPADLRCHVGQEGSFVTYFLVPPVTPSRSKEMMN